MNYGKASWMALASVSFLVVAACYGNRNEVSLSRTAAIANAKFTALITDSKGAPLEGALVTLVNNDQLRLTTRYTDKEGRVGFPQLSNDENKVRVRHVGFADQLLNLKPGMKQIKTSLVLATKEELLEQLPANVWAERINVTTARMNTEFRVQCMMCHQMGYPNTRIHKGRADWYGVYERMANKGTRALLTRESRDGMADALTAAFDYEGKLGMPRSPDAPSGKATDVEITEWRLKDGAPSMHDVAVGPDGNIYGVDTIGSNIWRLNPNTNEIKELADLQPKNRPKGTPLLLHTVMQGPDGKMWFTYALGNMIASLDIKTNAMKVYEMSYADGLYPHTMRFDTDGQLWFTVSHTNQLGTIDTATNKIVLYNMPTRTQEQADAARPDVAMQELRRQRTGDEVIAAHDEINAIPYGIAATPDGKIWFSQFNSRRIGNFDKRTKRFKMIDTPFGAPRRFRSDSKGNLWIPSYAEGNIYKYDPAADKFTRFDLPTGKGDAVYALAVDPRDDTVWACGSNSDTMMHLDPTTGNVVTYQLPSHVTFCREINFGKDGSVWTSYSQYPSASIEGGSSAFVRLKSL
jgi:virginiamycin B lyase